MRSTETDPPDEPGRPTKPALAARIPSPFGSAASASSWLRTVTVASVLAGCSSPMPPHLPPAPVRPPAAPGSTQLQETPTPLAVPALQPPREARNWVEYRRQAAERIVAANPQGIYLGPTPETLLAIPVLEVELHADGSVRRIDVLRHPKQARDTTQLAIDAVRRAAPYGNVARLPRPWKFTETFLFDDDRRFKPRTLD